jgi:hypothetical protein
LLIPFEKFLVTDSLKTAQEAISVLSFDLLYLETEDESLCGGHKDIVVNKPRHGAKTYGESHLIATATGSSHFHWSRGSNSSQLSFAEWAHKKSFLPEWITLTGWGGLLHQ